jgi:hypothetical protein
MILTNFRNPQGNLFPDFGFRIENGSNPAPLLIKMGQFIFSIRIIAISLQSDL